MSHTLLAQSIHGLAAVTAADGSYYSLASTPYVFPQAAALAGCLLLLLASLRGRFGAGRWRGGFRVAYAVLAGCCFLSATVSLAHSSGLYWGVSWSADGETLALQRLTPLGPITLPRHEIQSVTEMIVPERTIAGTQACAQFEVRTKDGASYWSGPIYHRSEAVAVRRTFETGMNRVARFSIGRLALH